MAAEEELAHENVLTVVLDEVALRHPIVFDIFNLCDMHGSDKLRSWPKKLRNARMGEC
jgi:hypothetical protein